MTAQASWYTRSSWIQCTSACASSHDLYQWQLSPIVYCCTNWAVWHPTPRPRKAAFASAARAPQSSVFASTASHQYSGQREGPHVTRCRIQRGPARRSPAGICEQSIASSHSRAIRQHGCACSLSSEDGKSSHDSIAARRALPTLSETSRPLASAKYIRHAPVVSAGVTENEEVPDLR